MRDTHKEAVGLLESWGFEVMGQSVNAVTLQYKNGVTFHVGKENWEAIDKSGERYHGRNIDHSRMFSFLLCEDKDQ